MLVALVWSPDNFWMSLYHAVALNTKDLMTQNGSYNLISSKSLFYHSKRKQIGNAWSANLRKETIPNIYIIFTFSVAGRRKLDLLSCADTESFKKPHYILNGLQNRPLTWRNFHKLKKKKKKAVTKDIALIFFFSRIVTVHYSKKRKNKTDHHHQK